MLINHNLGREPKPVYDLKDNRGVELEVNQKVAYNFSGEIAVGVITSIKIREEKLGYRTRIIPTIKINQIHPAKRESVVHNARSVLVLQED